MISKLKTFWSKFKWYVVATVAIVALFVTAYLLKGRGTEKLLRGAIKIQRDVVEKELKRKREEVQSNEAEIAKIDDKINEINQEIERVENSVERMDLKELSDAWKKISI